MQEMMKKRAAELLSGGKVNRVIGWKTGDFVYDVTPAVFETAEEIENDFVYTAFCGNNLSKYLVKEARKPGVTLVFLKPCDSYSFAQLLKEHRVKRESVYAVAVECFGKADIDRIKERGVKGVTGISEENGTLHISAVYGDKDIPLHEVMLEKCASCKTKKHAIYDEIIGEEGEAVADCDRFGTVKKLEAMTPGERYEFWRGELSRCIRCNACRNVCPACSCRKCVFDSNKFDSAQKANVDSFEEKMFHIIRAFHVAGRCTDCGECSRVCPQGIPLHLFNRKFIKDIDTFYGEYQAGEDSTSKGPLTNFTFEDVEPSIVAERG